MNVIPFQAWKGIIYPIVDRLFMGEDVPISDEYLREISDRLDDISDIKSEIDLADPFTWPSALSSLLKRNLQSRSINSFNEFKERYDYHKAEEGNIGDVVEFVTKEAKILSLNSRIPTSTTSSSDDYFLLPRGLVTQIQDDTRWSRWYVKGEKNIEDHRQLIHDIFWKRGDTRIFDAGRSMNSKEISQVDVSDAKYYGPLKKKRGKIERFYHDDKKWTIILQGKPGVGKTTFCYDFASKLSNKLAIFTSGYFKKLGRAAWKFIQKFVSPDVIILNDIDRLGSIETKLSYLESRSVNTKLVLMTTNYVDEIPTAVRRPGRVDHIIEMQAPDRDIREEILYEMAQEVGIDHVPKRHMDRIDEIHLQGSPAHVKEVLRRAKNWGWDDEEIWDIHNLEGEKWEYTE